MNIFEADVLNEILYNGYTNQRELAAATGFSVGVVNAALKKLRQEGYLDAEMLTEMAKEVAKRGKPQNAIILAAGVGLRMIPINNKVPKAFLEISGEALIERLIVQLLDAGIEKIDIVVGFLKEKFEYLCDKYGVNLVYNPEYATKNNLHSLLLVADRIKNTYIMPADIWIATNPFKKSELYTWYMVVDELSPNSTVRVNRRRELVPVGAGAKGNKMIGIAFLDEKRGPQLARRLKELAAKSTYADAFWEEALFTKEAPVYAKVCKASAAREIDSYEQLREIDKNSKSLDSRVLRVIAAQLNVQEKDIEDIAILKKGMTNRSFVFSAEGEKYICRIPGEGTDNLIDRRGEYAVYEVIKNLGITDEIVYISPESGIKITKYLQDASVCDPNNRANVKACMETLRKFHEMRITVSHEFDIFERMAFYESLWEGHSSIFRDHAETKAKVGALKDIINALPRTHSLTHIDAVPDNFLFTKDEIYLIDWEYAAMADPHTDIAMFAIYAMYERDKVEELIDFYFEGKCEADIRLKIYCYISACGLLWSNWCEYKRFCGVEFGEYSLRQYRYAKEYHGIAMEYRGKL